MGPLAWLLALTPAVAEEPAVRLVPPTEPYPLYLAGYQQPWSGFSVVTVPDPQLPEAGKVRWGLAVGDRFGVVEVRGRTGTWQLGIEAGWLAQFDVSNAWDNLGWDGLYGVYVAWAAPEWVAVRLAMAHDSAHVGDEYLLRTRFRRLRYTREEFRLGVSGWPVSWWRLYGEVGWAPYPPNENVDAWRLEGGTEAVSEPMWLDDQLGVFAAVDWTLFELDEIPGTIHVRGGLNWPQSALNVRLAVGYSGGRLPMAEFRNLPERTITVAIEAER